MAEIEIRGLREFRLRLRAMDSQLPRALRDAGKESARLLVAPAKGLVPSGPAKGGHVSSSVKAAATQRNARIQMGNAGRFRYAPWLSWGGTIRPNGGAITRARTSDPGGRYLWPAFQGNRREVEFLMRDALDRVARNSGLGGV